ncbi:MAG: zinc ABC transporter substrate-binding protein [Caldilineaceae bacterium]|nr:zinc ABC transporter substrate-binding protein [Caldilineaceae bacterium]
MNWRIVPLCLLLLLFPLAACVSQSTPSGSQEAIHTETVQTDAMDSLPALTPADLKPGEKLRVVATTNLVADVVGRVGGDAIHLTGLLPPGADPHGYQAAPADLRAINDAHLLFVNGLGLEESLVSILHEAQARTVAVNLGVETIQGIDGPDHADEHSRGANPHTWWSVAAVEQWTRNIEQALAAVDPTHAEQYAANANAYRSELAGLRDELDKLVGQLPPEDRKLATDHDTLAYFARDFDFQVVGLVVPSFSTLAEPSAKHLAALQDQIRAEDVRAIFVGSTVNPRQAEQLAQDLGIRVVPLFTDSLSAPNGPAPNYLAFMRYNVAAIVAALAQP